MEPSHLNRSVRVLLLDNAWPYEVSGNVLRFSVLQQLLNEIQPCDDLDRALGPLEIFDLIVARDTPFIRRVIEAWKDPKVSRQWLDFVYSPQSMALDGIFDTQCKGYETPLSSETPPAPQTIPDFGTASPSAARVILHDPSTGLISRSYPDDNLPHEHQLPPDIVDIWARALGRDPLGRLGRMSIPQAAVQLVMLAREECLRLYPQDPIVVVDFDLILIGAYGGTQLITTFYEWFSDSRGDEMYKAIIYNAAPSKSRSKIMRHFNHLAKVSKAQSTVYSFKESLIGLEIFKTRYITDDSHRIEYHSINCRPSMLVKSRSEQAIRKYAHELMNSRVLWRSIRACAAALCPSARYAMPRIVDTDERSLRLLSFDGGGVRGLSSLLVLENVLEQVKNREQLTEAPLSWEYFDMIAGTSTGGLIVILLGRLKLSVKQCIELYEDVAKEIFGSEQALTSSTRFSSARFKEVLQSRIRRILNVEHDEIFLRDPDVIQGSGSFVVAIERDHVSDPDHAVLLRSYETEADMGIEQSCYLWEAALATCAAPIFFCPASVRGKVLVDGGLGHNNPSEQLINEAEKRWPGRPIAALVSIGTGKARSTRLAKEMRRANAGKHVRALMNMALVLKSIATSSEHRERSVYNYFRGMSKLDCYYRFNVDVGMEVELHEYKRSQLPDHGLLAGAEELSDMLNASAPTSIEWLSFYHVDSTQESVRSGAVTLGEALKLPMDLWRSQGTELTRAERNNLIHNPSKPKSGIALIIETGGDQKPLHMAYVVNSAGRKMEPGPRFSPVLKICPVNPLSYAPTEESASSLETALWQAMPMEDSLVIDAETWDPYAHVVVRCSLDFKGWDLATSRAGKKYT
ncbi:hypothetical protein IFR05_014734 [Cadophora sp. M221]|nr:hypothetical protein IFR05_014734 [Cadophora sp. M221]